MDMTSHKARLDIEAITSVGSKYMESRILLTAIRLGLFGILGEQGPVKAGEVAGAAGADPRACAMLLDALCAMGFVAKEGGRYRVSPGREDYLVPGGPYYVGDILGHHERLWHRWSKLTDVVISGRPVPRVDVPGAREDEGARRDFILGMANIGAQGARELVRALDPRGPMTMLDVGGGPGTYALQFAEYNPELHAVVFDLPEVVPIAGEQIAARGLGERVSAVGGDYLGDELPGGNQLALLSNIIHSLGPDENKDLFGRIHRSLEPEGRLILKDFFVEEDRTGPLWPAVFSINMLVGTEDGRSYSEEEVLGWLGEAGFTAGARLTVARHSTVLVLHRR
jgi:SAM-dependent methyltransferase